MASGDGHTGSLTMVTKGVWVVGSAHWSDRWSLHLSPVSASAEFCLVSQGLLNGCSVVLGPELEHNRSLDVPFSGLLDPRFVPKVVGCRPEPPHPEDLVIKGWSCRGEGGGESGSRMGQVRSKVG